MPPHTANTLSTLWYCRQFLTVILFVAMLATHLAHCLFHFIPQSKSQASPQHRNKKTLHSNHHHGTVCLPSFVTTSSTFDLVEFEVLAFETSPTPLHHQEYRKTIIVACTADNSATLFG